MFQKILVSKNFMDKSGGIMFFSGRKIFVSLPKKSVGNPLLIQKILGIEKLYA